MKELNYDHLKLDNFFSFRSDLATNRKKIRKLTEENKENDGSFNGLPNLFSGRGKVDSSRLGTAPVNTATVVTENSGNVPLTKQPNNQLNAKQGLFFQRSAIISTTNNDDRSNFMQTQHSTFDHVDQSSNSIPLSDITRKTSNQPQNTRKGVLNRIALSNITNQSRTTSQVSPTKTTKTCKQPKKAERIKPGSKPDQFLTITTDINTQPSKSGFVDGSGERIPLSNLTNENDAQVFTRERCKLAENPRKVVASKMQRRITPTMDSITKELSFEDDLIHNDYDSAEFSTISDLQADEGDMFWDDEYEFAEVERLDAEENETEHNAVPEGYASLGPPTECCNKCHAIMWKEESVNKNVKNGDPKFSICCGQGQIKLPRTPPTPSYLQTLYTDPKKSNSVKRCIRLYNAMFAFTSMGGKVDYSINNGKAPYVYRLNGQNHHVFGSLIPNEGDDPKFCQLYIYDTEHEVENRMKWVKVDDGEAVDTEIVEGLVKMLDETNQLVKKFRYARERFKEQPIRDLKIKLKVCRSESGRKNSIGPSNEVAAVMVGDIETTVGERDIIIEKTNKNPERKDLERVCSVHPSLMALQYPLLFPLGEDGYHDEIPYVDSNTQSKKKRKRITMKEYYSYKLRVRKDEGLHVRLAGRLYQQYVVDAFSCIEQARLWWLRTHQTELRSDLYSTVAKKYVTGESETSNVGKGFILPANFLGSQRYMQQNFQDALAVCRALGHPDIFLTMTCNPLWDEILQMMKVVPGCSPQDSPDIVARVFHLKLEQLLDDIKKKNYFGTCLGVMYVVEFQKRGLPHVHMLIWLDSESKRKLTSNIDKYVSAEIPDPVTDPVGYAAVKSLMIHGPCGLQNTKSPCMDKFKCTKHFPKKYCSETYFDQSGFPNYKRRNTGITISKGKCELDNQWVVPYNRDLLVKYQCHMNVEICCHARSLKYLFKYCLKGHDRAIVEITSHKQKKAVEDEEAVDEINAYFDGRYICASEASYRIFGFPIHHRSISVLRFSFHLPGEKSCTFTENETLEKVVRREKFKHSQLESFFILNRSDPNARQYTYDQIPQHYVWNETDRIWTMRKKGKQIGRLLYTHHSAGELWYLRLLLSNIRGPTSFEALKTINGVQYRTFKDACKNYGLLDDDNEWHSVIEDCSKSGFPNQIRQLFVHIIVNCQVSDLKTLWERHWKHMIDDLLLEKTKAVVNKMTSYSDKQLQYFALAEIDKILKSIGKSLMQFKQLPQPPANYLQSGTNNLVIDETSYNLSEMEFEFNKLFPHCNPEQLEVYTEVFNSVQSNAGGVYFVYGSGGCGKTFVWKTLIYKLRSLGLIVLPVASSGIAATLMPGGRMAHSRFKIPIVLDDCSSCAIHHDSDIAELIKRTSLIIWDEVPMQHRYAFECLDRSLRDIMRSVDRTRYNMPFGGITVVLGGDFRQILPVINLGSRGDVVSASITHSRLWLKSKILLLHRNMRLNQGQNSGELESLKRFAEWVLQISNGQVKPPKNAVMDYEENDIIIPPEFCDPGIENFVENMIQWTYPDFLSNYMSAQYLSERAILTPTNQMVGHLNSLIVDIIPGSEYTFYSVDKAEDFGGTASELSFAFPPEYLNSINIPGLPPDELKLKEGVAVMLMRNLNQILGLCNGTRMMVTKVMKQCVECEVICGAFKGIKHFIP